MLCHCAEVAKNFQCCTTSCVFCNVIGEREISLQEVINVNEARGIAGTSERHQTLSPQVGSGHVTSDCDLMHMSGH